jgi:hypothetical protein
VPLGHVRDLVRKDTGEFVFIASCIEEPGVNTNESTWQREGIDRRVVDNEEREFVITVEICLSSNSMTNVVNVLRDLRIFDQLSTGANLAHDGATKLRFIVLGQYGIGRAAQIRQVDFGRRSARSQRQACGNHHHHNLFEKTGYHLDTL